MIKTQIKNEKLFILYPKNCLRLFLTVYCFFLLGGRFTDLLLLVLVHYLLIGLMILAGLSGLQMLLLGTPLRALREAEMLLL